MLNVAGFDRIASAAVAVTVESRDTVQVAPIPLYVLLKLIAFSDRGATKDPASVLHCLRHYAEDDGRRFGLDHAGSLVPFEYSTACLLGLDGRAFLDDAVRRLIAPVLVRLVDSDDALIDAVVRHGGVVLVTDDHRQETVDYFRWYQVGLGLG